ncbi:MAG: hypothetical protein KZQ64_01110 [gamma proteobacterium symbiont of Bathyaustriella thionipta]|nr:hypothetical protein [gamma proteobacterium symbiont of Bathyaustriella thionipta]MCU7950421.1 hypothetical protein [gamma proteobacterium symbiont of Bathyaustriella thionipta]MCU7951998.1 hypothetical protein [gamma proteobacterium symbiont of Bathyaustriella thionipta]MCU7957842.1 hypothetical protein [gamma proteobacterium symbiont of Bathyaustriella thionipta]MCU7967840.1 hypothetical protein [gamma proteobacterium symbiont of Bathyaustriella thionipta]
MQATEHTLFKNLPVQTKPEKTAFNLQMSAVDLWYEDLPMVNIRVATKAMYKALKSANSQKVSYKKRLYFLEKIHATITQLTSNLKKLNLNRKLPLDEKHSRISVLIQKLHQQMSTGYKCVLRDLLHCRIFFLCPSKRKLMALVLTRIIRHHSLLLIAHYQFYSSPKKMLWSDLHQLFLLADREKLLNKKIPDPTLMFTKETSIKTIYLQILLMSIADPYRMAQHHICSIFNQLEEWSPLADIHQHLDSDDKDALVIDLSSHSHPAFTALQDAADKSTVWTLNTSKLDYAHLFEHFDGPETQTTEINGELLKQLSLSWGIAPTRQHSRRPAKSKLKVAIGLNNVHYVLNGYNEPDWMQTTETETTAEGNKDLELSEHVSADSNFNSRTIVSTVKVSDIWGEVFQNKSLTSSENKADDDIEVSQQQVNPTDSEWEMVNESIGGYCLLWDQNGSVNAKVGEVIAISHEVQHKEGYWFVGSIRWLKCLQNNKIQIGVQIIAPNALAVSTAKFVSMQEGMKSRAILLPAIPILKQPKTLITTALGYETRDQVILDEYRLINANITSVKTKVILLDTLESSSHFSRFKYSLAEDFYKSTKKTPVKDTKEDTLSLDSNTDFDSIWDDL